MIRVLDDKTIEKIAAGEVVERPSSIVKELLENAVDAGATAVSVDIKNGGIDMIRVTDNGSGIDKNEVRTAFLSHATSKLRKIEDLYSIRSFGFRGEALSSIAAVSKVELLTKTENDPVGVKYVIEGGTEVSFDEAGVPEGTTFIIKDLFYNTPARRKFLKSAATEAGYISTLVEETALSNPGLSVKYSVNGSNRLLTSGKNDLKEVIYRIYGRDISDSLLSVEHQKDGMSIKGYISKPLIARGSRSMENYFVNGRYIKDDIIAKAIEDGYAGFLMQHKFPFAVLMLELPPEDIDINVHPRKMEIKFSDSQGLYEFVRTAVRDALEHKEFINNFTFEKDDRIAPPPKPEVKAPEPFEIPVKKEAETAAVFQPSETLRESAAPDADKAADYNDNVILKEDRVYNADMTPAAAETVKDEPAEPGSDDFSKDVKGAQLDLFEEKILSPGSAERFKLIGQVFNTYWIIEYRDEMLVIDQHAAHEKVNYERFMEEFKNRSVTTQNLEPPIIITLNGEQRAALEKYMPRFSEMGFEIEPFGGNDFAIRTVPYNLYGLNENEVFVSLLDELSSGKRDEEVSVIHDKIASMSCKAAIKGNTEISVAEAEALISQLLSLKDPYNCPHGRPTIIKMSKHDLEKKFKRVL
ncbi:MAG: DNA mismatch repair endonuclease MutL [Lachnospiraceae bacterium]|nr:DNA mismatch repair endonuclease MutL [Lachnospiraceae bacterium]